MQLMYFQSRPVQLYVGILAAMLVFGVLARPVVETLAPDLSVIGIRVVVNWLFVALVVVFGVAILGTWLLWTDHNTRVVDEGIRANAITRPTGSRMRP